MQVLHTIVVSVNCWLYNSEAKVVRSPSDHRKWEQVTMRLGFGEHAWLNYSVGVLPTYHDFTLRWLSMCMTLPGRKRGTSSGLVTFCTNWCTPAPFSLLRCVFV